MSLTLTIYKTLVATMVVTIAVTHTAYAGDVPTTVGENAGTNSAVVPEQEHVALNNDIPRVCTPQYPSASRSAHEQGTVRIQFTIGIDGRVESTSILKSSGFKRLDHGTEIGLSRCVFKAAMKDGVPVKATFTTDYVWRLDNSPINTLPRIVDFRDCEPVYPPQSILAKEVGTVTIWLDVGADDRLLTAEIEKSSGSKSLDHATLDGLSRCKFKAASENGKPVRSTFTMDYVWELN